MMAIAETVTDGFKRWLMGLCTYREDSWTTVYRLHNSYAIWALRDNAPPCRLRVFTSLLRGEGVRMERSMVYGLCLAADVIDEQDGKELEPLPPDPLSHNEIEQEGFRRQAAAEEGDDPADHFETEADLKAWIERERIRCRLREMRQANIEILLSEYGARMMRPYEHWNEQERLMEYLERER